MHSPLNAQDDPQADEVEEETRIWDREAGDLEALIAEADAQRSESGLSEEALFADVVPEAVRDEAASPVLEGVVPANSQERSESGVPSPAETTTERPGPRRGWWALAATGLAVAAAAAVWAMTQL